MEKNKSLGEIAYDRKRRGENLINYNYQKNGRCKITVPIPIAKQANIEPGVKVLILWDGDIKQFTIRLITDSDQLKFGYTAQHRKAEGGWRVYFTFKHYPNLQMPKASYRIYDYQISNGLCFLIRGEERG